MSGGLWKAGIRGSTGGWDPVSPCFTVKLSNGEVTVTDGPYAEAKEVVAGFAIMEVGSKDEAIKWCTRFITLAGEGSSEVHQIPEVPTA